MKNELNTNNSKKLIIGVSIIFCTVILIIGGTLAFFTQSDSKELGNIVSSNDNNAYINYIEEKSMMLDNLIPMKGEDIEKALFRGNTCVDDNGYNVCSIYMFSLENTYGEVQKINISMIPTANSFTNLKYMVARMRTDGLPNIITEEPLSLEKNNLNPITLIENETLYPGEDNIGTYAILFYIESMDYDQTEEDAGKHFGAAIRIDSITTGKYVIKQYGASCWTATEIPEGEENAGTYKLEYFHGLNDNGSVKEECSGYISQDTDTYYYNVEIPAEVGGKQITTLGYNLFSATNDPEVFKPNYYNRIKKVIINDGITTIEDAHESDDYSSSYPFSTFEHLGYVSDNSIGDYCLFDLEVSLPDSLVYIGNSAFEYSCIKDLKLPSNLKTIGDSAFSNNLNLTSDADNPLVIPYSVTSIGNSAFSGTGKITKLTFAGSLDIADVNELNIGARAFSNAGLSYTEKLDPLILPARLKSLGSMGFYNQNLKYVKYMGSAERFATVGGNYYYGTYAKSYEEYDNE